MGNCIQKPKKIVIKDSSIEVDHIPPMDPSKDPFGNYLWINIHTNNVNFLKKQEEGFVVSMSDSSIGHKWLRKINSEKSNFSGNTPFPIISGIIMENYSNNYSNNSNNNNNNSNYNSNDWPSPPVSFTSDNNQLHENNKKNNKVINDSNNNSNNDCQLPSI